MGKAKGVLKPTEKTYRLLYAKSGNRCAFPKCPNPITHNRTLVGEVAHIKGESRNGPRYDDSQTDDQRRSYENVLLLCGIHHKVVDDDVESYPVERLERMKAQHESQATSIPQDELDNAVGLLIAGDVNVTAINPNNSVTAGVYQNTINYHYGSQGQLLLDDNAFVPVVAKNGEARFRAEGERVGKHQPHQFASNNKAKDIFLEDGPSVWFRLMPTAKQKKVWTFVDLS
jgi:hypothetical protein